ncbi:MAG: hypothetical protein U9R66_03475 [Thermodesulfobacteriota bacterium]|nr:hypothetical protein [Thermodesulfobacteriota bacterium]
MKYVVSALAFATVVFFTISALVADDIDFVWVKAIGGTSIRGTAISTDDSGNVYTTGYFTGTVDFDPGEGVVELTSATPYRPDIFISKLDSNGNLIWAKSMGGPLEDRGQNIYIDDYSNIYTTGGFTGTVDFDPGEGVVELTSATADRTDIFISKLDSNGKLIWAKSMGGGGYDDGYAISADDSGNVYASGCFGDNADFDPGDDSFILINSTGLWCEIFINKLDSDGNFLWAKALGPGNGNGISLDDSDHVYIAGYWVSGNLAGDDYGEIYHEGFTSKLDSNGNFLWTNTITGSSLHDISVDDSGYVYTTGNSTINKLDSNGNFIWHKAMTGVYGLGVSVDNSGNVYTTGEFQGTVDFDPGEGVVELTSAGKDDIFISQFDSNGKLIWAKSMGGTSTDTGYAISVDNSYNIFTTGVFFGTVDFDPGEGVVEPTSTGNYDVFVLKLKSGGPFKLSVSLSGDGIVTSHPSGIDCPKNCTDFFYKNTSVTLTAVPSEGASFGNWSGGGCSGSGTCTVTMDSDIEVTATFGKEGVVSWLMLLLK